MIEIKIGSWGGLKVSPLVIHGDVSHAENFVRSCFTERAEIIERVREMGGEVRLDVRPDYIRVAQKPVLTCIDFYVLLDERAAVLWRLHDGPWPS